jgi:predicted dienelactone hydrolase
MSHRSRIWVQMALMVVMFLSLSLVAAQDAAGPEPVGLRPDAPPYALHGPYWVGTQDRVIDPDSAEPLEVTIWYPALNPEGLTEEVTYPATLKFDVPDGTNGIVYGHALKDAALDMTGGPYPLVVFSPGFGAARTNYAHLTEHLASYGFVVIAPDHHEFFDPTWADIPKSTISRPQDVLKVIAFADVLAAAGGSMEGLINMDLIAVSGHSYGGYTALAAAAARFDIQGFNARCDAARAASDPNAWLCDTLVPFEDEMVSLAGLDSMPDGLWPAWADPRVDAIIPLAGDSYIFDQAGLAEITIPVMAMGGTLDTSTPYEWGADPTYEYISSDTKALVTFVNAEHMIFGSTCTDIPWAVELGVSFFCSDPVWDMQRTQDITHHLATAFLLDVLNGDAEAHTALAPAAVDFAGVTYQAEGY